MKHLPLLGIDMPQTFAVWVWDSEIVIRFRNYWQRAPMKLDEISQGEWVEMRTKDKTLPSCNI